MMTRPMYRQPGPAAARLDISTPDETEPVQQAEVVRWLSQMRADMAETLGGIMLRSVRPVPITALPTLMSSSPGRLVGWSLHESTGANPFVVKFHNGSDAAQDVVAISGGGGGTVDTKWFGGGISFTEGLFVEILTGGGLSQAVEGTVYLGAAD
ncbi:hypothetical protein OG762_52420 (plasmid) [Streptomyces sp. NBC_01136]|uniref:hypothetical protein n=1 Tax=Streptomyces sp. NBC_01136 TaxID=2903754 RepID=UPI00386DC971|nr:hypothetical protein OG762_52420 [Streptomyces sp. NBC_01136]